MEIGNKVTWHHDIIGTTGAILHQKGDVSIIRDIDKKGDFIGLRSGTYYPEKLNGFLLEDEEGLWFPSCFEETQNLK
jgi:hypothetical protein